MWFRTIVIFLKQHIVLCVIWVLLLAVLLYVVIDGWIRKCYELTCDFAIFLVNKKNAVFIDVRNQDNYDSGYIINSINIPIANIKRSDTSSLLQMSKDRILIIVNDNGIVPYSIKKYFNNLGFKEVYVLQGGVHSWRINNFPILLKKKNYFNK